MRKRGSSPGWADTMQKWYEWLEEMTKDEKETMEEMRQRKVAQKNNSAEGSSRLLHKISKPTAWRGGPEILTEGEDVRLLDCCEAKGEEWAKHWQCNEEVQN